MLFIYIFPFNHAHKHPHLCPRVYDEPRPLLPQNGRQNLLVIFAATNPRAAQGLAGSDDRVLGIFFQCLVSCLKGNTQLLSTTSHVQHDPQLIKEGFLEILFCNALFDV